MQTWDSVASHFSWILVWQCLLSPFTFYCQGAYSRLYQYHWVRYRESAQCQRLVPPLWLQLNPIEAAFCTCFCLITNNCLSMKSAYCLHGIGTWCSTRTYSAVSVSPTRTHAQRDSEQQVSVCSHQRQACCKGSFRTSVLLVLSLKVQRRSPRCPFSWGSAQGEQRSLPSCMFYISELLQRPSPWRVNSCLK